MRLTQSAGALAVVVIALSACATPRSSQPGAADPSPTPTDNGISVLSAADIAHRAIQALDVGTSVHVKGFVSDEGESAMSFDVVKQDATDGRATLTAGGQTVEIIRVGDYDYAKASASFWASYGPGSVVSKAGAARAEGKYVKASHSGLKLATLSKFLDLPLVVKQELGEEHDLVKGGQQVINGVPTIALTAPDAGTIYIATVGPPDVIRVTSPGGGSDGIESFSGYLATVTVEVPPADQVIDIASL
jgi:hypothetical protein